MLAALGALRRGEYIHDFIPLGMISLVQSCDSEESSGIIDKWVYYWIMVLPIDDTMVIHSIYRFSLYNHGFPPIFIDFPVPPPYIPRKTPKIDPQNTPPTRNHLISSMGTVIDTIF